MVKSFEDSKLDLSGMSPSELQGYGQMATKASVGQGKLHSAPSFDCKLDSNHRLSDVETGWRSCQPDLHLVPATKEQVMVISVQRMLKFESKSMAIC